MVETPVICPHCGSSLKKWLVPEKATWDAEYFWVCFNENAAITKTGGTG